MAKPDFKDLPFSRHRHWTPAGGNTIGYFQPMYVGVINQDLFDAEDRKAYDTAKKIYDEKIFVGARFKAGRLHGEENKNDHTAIITYISSKTNMVTWEFEQAVKDKYPKLIFKKQKWHILGMVSLIEQSNITML